MSVWLVEDTRAHVLPVGQPLESAHRDGESWAWRVLDLRDQMTGVLSGVTGGSLEMSVHTDTRGTGTVTWAGLAEDAPDWSQIRLQPIYTATFPNGVAVSWPMGVFLPAVPRVQHHGGHATAEVALYDKTLVLREASLTKDTGIAAGANPVEEARQLILNASGDTRTAIEDTTEILRSPMFWEVGTSVLRAVNDLLDAAGYFALWADGEGIFCSTRYVEPMGRPVVWDFEDGAWSIYKDGFTVTDDWFHAPNHVIAISRSDGDAAALVSHAKNEDPADRLSYPSRGRWVVRTEEGVEATSQAVLDAYAARLLREARTPRSLELEHAPVLLDGNARARFSRTGVVTLDGVVQSWRWDCKPGALMRTVVQEVAA